MSEQFQIARNKTMGRYLVAKNGLQKGDTIIDEIPFALGPKVGSSALCLQCFCKVSSKSNGPRCSLCMWPLCDSCTLAGSPNHTGECNVFSASKQKFQNMEEDSHGCSQLDCITPLRVLLKMEQDPERWATEVEMMEYHDLSRRTDEVNWNVDLNNVAKYLRGPCKLQRFSEDLIMQVIGILEVNAFEGRTSEGSFFRALYPTTGILAHNCVPNTTRTIYPSENYRIRLRAMVDIQKGDKLLHCYTYTMHGTMERQKHLKSGKFFICKCARCADPTELGTHYSSHKCSKCKKGWVVTTNPYDPDAIWKCLECNFTAPILNVENVLTAMRKEILKLDAMDIDAKRVERTIKLLNKFQTRVHPNHYLNITLKQSLIELMGRARSYTLLDLPDLSLQQKIDYCQDVLRILDKFEPGISRQRAFTIYEMHVPMVLIAKNFFIHEKCTQEQLKMNMQEIVELLTECSNILRIEDKTTLEGNLSVLVDKALEQLTIGAENL